jgi:ankyrin repeat protein
MRGHIKIVLLLIKFDIDIEHQDEDGNTGLHIAA